MQHPCQRAGAVLGTAVFLAGCAPSPPTGQEQATPSLSPTGTGTLVLVANGEDFIRQGLTTKDGWRLEFDRAEVTFATVEAYQTDPPFDADGDQPLQAQATAVLLREPQTVDLAQGEADAPPIPVAEVEAAAGTYNALAWKLAEKGIALQGQATKDGQTVDFTLTWEQPLDYTCGEYVGEERKGFLPEGAQTEMETTFHFDHVFGDAGTPPEDALNRDALGFGPLAVLAEGGQLAADRAQLKEKLSPQDYQTLERAIAGLGHVGEGHCALKQSERQP